MDPSKDPGIPSLVRSYDSILFDFIMKCTLYTMNRVAIRAVAIDIKTFIKKDALKLFLNSKLADPDGGSPIQSEGAKDASTSRKYDQSGEILNVHDVQSKYMNKMRNKMGGSLLPLMEKHMERIAKSTGSRPAFKKDSDAQTLRLAKEYASSSATDTDKEAMSIHKRWLLEKDFGSLFDNLRYRGIPVGLVIDDSVDDIGLSVDRRSNDNEPSDRERDLKRAERAEFMDEIVRQVSRTVGGFIGSDSSKYSGSTAGNKELLFKICYSTRENSKEMPSLESHLSSIITSNYIKPDNLLVISTSNEELLKCGRLLSCRTTFYRAAGCIASAPPTDFTASSALDIQDILEDMNGVSLRDRADTFRIKELE